jgi:hypothetical protein
MTNFLDGGQEKTKRRRELWNRVFRDPAMADVNYEEFPLLSREELIRRTLKLQAIVLRVILQRKTTHLRDKAYLQRILPLGVAWPAHDFGFIPALRVRDHTKYASNS